MACRRGLPALLRFAAVALLVAQLVALAAAAKSNWLTLDGMAPRVLARGGFSGLFPDSSNNAYQLAKLSSVEDVVFWCDVQLTKEEAGICFPSLRLDNGTNIDTFYSKQSTHMVDGAETSGFFTIDYTLEQLENVSLTQGIFSRSPDFDGVFAIMTIEDVFQQYKPRGYWLNAQHDAFFSQNKLSMQKFILGVLQNGIPVDYLSSPEIGLLRSIGPQLKKTSLIFRFLSSDETEPTTNQTYGSLSKNLKFIKTFASGILVPKTYIWPVDSSLYLQAHTSIVSDAHGVGLQVFAADFANDNVLSYNYSYNPVAEYLNFIDNGEFSVDGLLSDFPITPSEAVGCFAHLGGNSSRRATQLVISFNGASGDYPGCTDLAYQQAIMDGSDIIDCSVQISKDGVPFCLSSINLVDSTNVAQTELLSLQEDIPELQMKGVFSFRLTWKDIQGLTQYNTGTVALEQDGTQETYHDRPVWDLNFEPKGKAVISNPYSGSILYRNPKYKNAGKLVSLSDFLVMAKNSTKLSGVLIKIEHAAYLAQKQGVSVVDAVLKALGDAGYSNQTAKKVMIQSTNSSVLEAFKGKNYDLVYELDEVIRDVQNSTIAEIKSFASSVVLQKQSIYPVDDNFTKEQTKVVDRFHSFDLSVYVGVFRNEFISMDWDFLSDPIVELNSFAQGAGIDGFITEYPKAASQYQKNRCLDMKNTPPYMLPVPPKGLLPSTNPAVTPPAVSPAPILSDKDVSEPPLPPVLPAASPPAASPPNSSSSASDGQRPSAAMLSLAMSVLTGAAFLC